MSQHRPTDRELSGMTVNERLVVCGLIEQWDEAVQRRQRGEMIMVLRQVALSDEQAALTADSVLSNPQKYGF